MKAFPSRQLIILGLLVLVACGLSMFFADQYLSSFLTPEQYQSIYRPVRELTELGVSNHFFVFCAVALIASFVALKQKKWSISSGQKIKLEKLRTWTLTFLYSLLASGAVVQIFKFIFGRQRPHRTDQRDPLVFDFFTTNWHFHSFPSGHTQTLFTVATALTMAFPKRAVWFYLGACVVAFTRVLLMEHFFSDLLMGGFIGYAMTLWVFSKRASYLSSK